MEVPIFYERNCSCNVTEKNFCYNQHPKFERDNNNYNQKRYENRAKNYLRNPGLKSHYYINEYPIEFNHRNYFRSQHSKYIDRLNQNRNREFYYY